MPAKRVRAVFAWLLLSAAAAAQEATLDAGHWQLFIDNYAIGRATGFDRIVHHPRPMGVVIPPDKPWESSGVHPLYFAQRPDGTFIGYYDAVWWAPNTDARASELADMVYSGGQWKLADESKKRPLDRAQQYVSATAFATSRDGIHWNKPNLGLVAAPAGIDWEKAPPYPSPTGSSTENNLGVPFRFYDLGRYGNVGDPSRRFAISYKGKAYFASALPDFIHDPDWRTKLTPTGGTFSPRWSALDFWDSQHKEWVAFVQNAVPHWLPAREIARFSSSDLKSWRSQIVVAPDPEDPHSPTCYDEPMYLRPFFVDGTLFGLLSWFHGDRTTPDGGPTLAPGAVSRIPGAPGWPWPLTEQNPYPWPWARKATNEMRITISHDGGRTWDRLSSREAWIPHGTEQDSYDRLVISCCPPVRVGDEDWFYMGDCNGDHLSTRADAAQSPYYHDRVRRSCIALYTQKHDRFVSLSTGEQEETLITNPFRVEGSTLHLNVDASRGTVRVGIADYGPRSTLHGTTLSTAPHLMEEDTLPGFSLKDCKLIQSNQTDCTVTFTQGASLEALRGHTVVLVIQALDSDLYGFRVE